MAKSNWTQLNKEKEKYYQYKSRSKKFVLEMATSEDLEDLEDLIKRRKENLKMLYFWYYGGPADFMEEEVKDFEGTISEAHYYYKTNPHETTNLIFIVKKEDYENFDKENGWIGDIAHFTYDVIKVKKYQKYVYDILFKYYEEDENEFSDINFEKFKNISLKYNLNVDYGFIRDVEIYYVDYLDAIIEKVNNEFI